MAVNQKITEFAALSSAAAADLLAIVDDPSGGAATKKIVVSDLIRSYKTTAAETSAGVTPTDFTYKSGTVLRYGAVGATALQDAIDGVGANGVVVVSPGTYEKISISDSDRTFIVEAGAIFTLPDGDITGVDTSGTPALTVAGDNIRFRGFLSIDGNKANQDTSAFAGDERSASLKIIGDHVYFDDVDIVNAFWDGFTLDGGATPGAEALDTQITRLRIKDPENRAGTLWSCIGYKIGEIVVDSEVLSLGDHRIRTGNDSIDTAACSDGRIDNVYSPNNIVVVEKDTDGLSFGHVRAMSWKCEDCNDIRVESLDLRNIDDGADTSFAIIGTTNVQIGSVSIKDHAGSTAVAGAIEGAATADIQIGRYFCDGALGGADGLRIRDATRLTIESVIANNNTGKGVFVDESGGFTQSDIRFGSVIADGNTGTDFEFQPGILRSSFGHLTRTATGTYAGIAADCWSYPFGISACGRIAVDGGDGSTTISNDFNVASAVEDSTGQYSVVFTNTITEYIVKTQGEDTEMIDVITQNGSGFTVLCRDQSGTLIRPTSFWFEFKRVDQDNI